MTSGEDGLRGRADSEVRALLLATRGLCKPGPQAPAEEGFLSMRVSLGRALVLL